MLHIVRLCSKSDDASAHFISSAEKTLNVASGC